jgi:hypothetical protein
LNGRFQEEITDVENDTLQAGAAQRVITPPVGTPLVGYASRAAGDLAARYVHDDLWVKALVLRAGGQSWAVLSADLIGLDAVAVGRIRATAAGRTGLRPEAILACATHTHAGPPVCPVAGAVAPADLNAVRSDGSLTASYGQAPPGLSPTAYYAELVDEAWRDTLTEQASAALVEAWETARDAEVSFGLAEVDGVASSRRVRLPDGSWGDPRREMPAPPPTRSARGDRWTGGAAVISRTEIDPLVRVLAVRERGTQAPLAIVVNYATHPWIFNTSGISAELAGAVAGRVAAAWRGSGGEAPVVLYTTGPQGDVTLIWNIAVDKVWRSQPDESLESSLSRREQGFDEELARLGDRLAGRVLAALAGRQPWQAGLVPRAWRREVALPLKAGYRPPPELRLADWQRAAPAGHHLTELQVLRLGPWALLALPGEPFTTLGRQIREQAPFQGLLIVAIANDYGPVSYMADRADFEQGGYELVVTPAAAETGERLVAEALALLRIAAG